jgi:HEAT repeat protein
VYWCFSCYGLNPQPSGRCQHCGREIAAPQDISWDEGLIWTLGHPDGDRAMLAARTLGDGRVPSAAQPLRRLVTSSKDPFLAAQALRSLLKIEGTDALRPLLDDLASHGPFMLTDIARSALNR